MATGDGGRLQGIISAGKTALDFGKTALDFLQCILSTGTYLVEEVQLRNELDRLQQSLPKARILINRGEWGIFKNKDLAELLSHLKDTTYDAEDLLRQLDDQVLRQNIEDADRCSAGQLLSSSLNLAKTFFYGTKKRVKDIQDKLDKVVVDVEAALNLLNVHVEAVQLMPETSSIISAPEVFGRDNEQDALIEKLGVTIGREDARDQVMQQLGVPLTRGSTSARSKGKRAALDSGTGTSTARPAQLQKGNSSRVILAQTNCTGGNVSVVPIVGIGGVGKTTLAQFIYNDSRVEHHFTVRAWVCVSDFFDKKRITKEILESIPGEEFNGSSLNALQEELRKRLKLQKFLLVLDDIWPNACHQHQWEEFYAPLRHGLEGSMILVTTRYPKVADLVITNNCKPVQLEGLPNDTFWEFFQKCAFGRSDPGSYPELRDIGMSISSRLRGSPLAAKTLGRLLNMNLSTEHWMTVQNSELWQLPHEEYDILPALQLSYLYLPQELKRCFAFCSMFPKDYSFERQEIVDAWVAQGFVALAPGENMRLEDVGFRLLDDLRSRFLFQSDPKFPNQSKYVMHDLIHDMAQSVSVDECFLMKDLSYQNQRTMPQTVRHLSIEVDGESLRGIRGIQHFHKLHSLRFGIGLDVEITWFSQLSNVLFLSLKGCKLEKLPESLCELKSLRYLDISYSQIQELPEKFCCMYSLQFLDATRSRLQRVHKDVTKLRNLRYLALPSKAFEVLSRVSGLGNLSFLRNLRYFAVGRKNGRRIDELKAMNQLSGTLTIRNLRFVQSKEEASQARLVEKQYVKALDLCWRANCPYNVELCFSENEVVEGLRPHSTIESLRVHGFCGDRFSPSWFSSQDLPNLRSLQLSVCPHLKILSLRNSADGTQAGSTGNVRRQQHPSSRAICSAFTLLTSLHIVNCRSLTNLDQLLSPENLPSVKSIVLETCQQLVSIPNLEGFTCLEDLKIYRCSSLVCPPELVLPPSLQRLSFWDCGELDRSFPACLGKVTGLTLLQLVECHNVKFIPLDSIIATNMLKCLVLGSCSELLSIGADTSMLRRPGLSLRHGLGSLSSFGGFHCLSSVQHVDIFGCPKLTQWPFQKEELRTKEGKELLSFLRDTNCVRIASFVHVS